MNLSNEILYESNEIKRSKSVGYLMLSIVNFICLLWCLLNV